MYDCEKTRELLGPYLDNEIETVPTQELAAHLEQCPSCRRELEIIRSQNELLGRAIRSVAHDTAHLRGAIEAVTVRNRALEFQNLSFPRVPVWALSGVIVLLLAVAGIFYLPGKFSVTQAHPLYQAAASDHLNGSNQSSASDWITSQQTIIEKAKQLLHDTMSPPLTIGKDYQLVRARLCQLNGEAFLHLVYETTDGRQASLFLCAPAQMLPSGQRQLTLNGHDIQSSNVSGLSIASMLKGDCLFVAAAREDGIPTAILSLLIS